MSDVSGGLRLRGGSTVIDPPGNGPPEIEGLLEYHRDLLASFGERDDPETFAAGRNVTYADLVDRLLAGDAPAAGAPDLVLLAYALPDVHPFTTTAAYANWRMGNAANSFAVSEQGLVAPFSALRIAAAYRAAGRTDRVALAVVEQATLPNRDPVVHGENLVDSGALLVFDASPATGRPVPAAGDEPTGAGDGDPYLVLDQVVTRDTPDGLAARIAATARPGTTLVVGGRWAGPPIALADGVRRYAVPPRTYCTSTWLALAAHHRDWARHYQTVILYDSDPRSGRVAALTLRSTATTDGR